MRFIATCSGVSPELLASAMSAAVGGPAWRLICCRVPGFKNPAASSWSGLRPNCPMPLVELSAVDACPVADLACANNPVTCPLSRLPTLTSAVGIDSTSAASTASVTGSFSVPANAVSTAAFGAGAAAPP